MNNSIERIRLQRIRAAQKSGDAADASATQLGYDSCEVDDALLKHLASIDAPKDLRVSREEIEALLEELAKAEGQSKFDSMLRSCGEGVIQSLAGPFGLGAVVSRWDKDGGNVDTIHNVREGVYATKAEKDAYANRGEYNSTAYHSHPDYVATNRRNQELFEKGELQDIYTGERLIPGEDKLSLEHKNPASRVHDDPGRVLADVDGPMHANRDANLGPINQSTNSSKGAKTPIEYRDKLRAEVAERRAEIHSLEGVESPSVEQTKRLYKLRKKESVSEERLEQAEKDAVGDGDGHLNDRYYSSDKFFGRVVWTSATEAAKMGAQQALGAAIAEFFLGAIAEIKDWYHQEKRELMLSMRLKRVVDRVSNRWKEYLDLAIQGSISGFLSNLATTLINIFIQTEKRLVRMIREGFFSLVRSVKIVIFPPGDMTTQEALHASTKLLFAGTILIGGIAVEEILLDHMRVAGFGLFAEYVAPVIVGSLTAVAMALSAFALDRLDLFGAESNAQHERFQADMGKRINQSIEESEALLLVLQNGGSALP